MDMNLDWNNGLFVSYSAEQEGIKADPMELSQLVNFVKRNKFQSETFFIGQNQCKFYC